ncbi:MAG: TauD/TfdA family dioxygenase [Henriciella sp.]
MEMKTLPGVGAEISGVDLRHLSAAEDATIRKAFVDQGVIFFRGQDLSEDDHIAFAERFGEINVNRFFAAHPAYPQIAMVAKDVEDRDNIGGGWHTDHSYDVEPALGSVLVARELPDSGGDTRFASMYRAFETLPEPLKQEIEGKRAIHSARHIFGKAQTSYYSTSDAGNDKRIGNAAVADTLTDVTHPIVITHPLSGKKALYVNPAFTIGIEGMDEAAGKALLQRLYAHAMKAEHVYQFKWEPGSIAFWDNRSTWHWALNDYHGQRRVMHRITIEGCALN